MGAFWCELAWLGADRVESDVLVQAHDERIASVSVGVAAPAEATRMPGLVIPGFANVHSHAFQRAMRGRVQTAEGSFWTWRERMYELAEALDPDRYRDLARAAFGEMALAGITTVGEFHYLHHDRGGARYSDANAMGEALIAAAREAGIRLTLLDACYLHGGIGTAPEGAQRRFSDGDGATWAERVSELGDRPGMRVGAAIHSVRAVDPEAAGMVAVWAERRGAPLHAHVSEQPSENEASIEAYGSTPTAVLADAGALNERFVAVHGTHLAGPDVGLLGELGCACCLCPTTERDLADGIGAARELADAGIRLALGTDSNAIIDMLEEARAAELDQRLASGVRGRSAPVGLLEAATSGGHASLGWPEAGRIESGALCDLVAVDLEGARLAGIVREDPIPSLVFAGSAADVRDVVVGGRQVVRDGVHLRFDVGAELRTAIEAAWS
jgi:formiminoglutamate deiminase